MAGAVAYDETFHANRGGYREPAERCLLAAFAHFGVPASFLDLGCGTGDLVRMATKLGVMSVGVDLSIVEDETNEWTEDEQINQWYGLFKRDLRNPLALHGHDTPESGRFDLVWCTEVAEHLDDARNLLSAVIRYAEDRVIWTAAQPGQKGVGHVNCRSREAWIEDFALRGFRYEAEETEALRATWAKVAGRCRWYPRNLSVFRRSRG